MKMTLDFRNARTSACHCYVGVAARIDDGPPVTVTIAPDGCHTGAPSGATIPCGHPEVDDAQAWSVAMLLTGDEKKKPGVGSWDHERGAITFPLGQRKRVMMG